MATEMATTFHNSDDARHIHLYVEVEVELEVEVEVGLGLVKE